MKEQHCKTSHFVILDKNPTVDLFVQIIKKNNNSNNKLTSPIAQRDGYLDNCDLDD